MGLGGAPGIGRGMDAGDGCDVFTVGGEDDGGEAGDVDGVTGVNDAAGLAFNGFEVGGVVVAGDVGVFAIGTVVEEFADGDALDEFGDAADVVDMEMGDEEMVDAGDAGVAHGGLDAGGVAACIVVRAHRAPAGVDEERRAGGSDKERGLASFDIDGVDEEMLGWRLRVGGEEREQSEAADGQQRGGEGAGQAQEKRMAEAGRKLAGDLHCGNSV